MNIFKTIQVVSCICLFSSAVAGERIIPREAAAEIVRKINSETIGAKNFSARLQYNIYKRHSDSNVYQTDVGYYKRSGSNEHSLLIGIETIQNTTERLVIDTGGQSIALSNPNQKPQLVEASMQMALSMCEKITVSDLKEFSVLKFYLGEKSAVGFNTLEITYVKSTYYINKLTLYYQNVLLQGYEDINNPKVEIVYSDISTSRVPQTEFETTEYLKKKDKVYQLTLKYQAYTFFNQIIANKNQ